MKVETRTYTDGSVEAIITRDDGSKIAAVRVSWMEHADECEVFKVETSCRQGREESVSDETCWLVDIAKAYVPDDIAGIEP